MRFVKSWKRRNVVPIAIVGSAISLALLTPAQTFFASNAAYGYGYANNCGVKGSGFHDHGKACPNRPFPGKGKGVMEKLSGATAPSTSSEITSDEDTQTDVQVEVDDSMSSSTGAGHSHGHGLHVKGQGRNG